MVLAFHVPAFGVWMGCGPHLDVVACARGCNSIGIAPYHNCTAAEEEVGAGSSNDSMFVRGVGTSGFADLKGGMVTKIYDTVSALLRGQKRVRNGGGRLQPQQSTSLSVKNIVFSSPNKVCPSFDCPFGWAAAVPLAPSSHQRASPQRGVKRDRPGLREMVFSESCQPPARGVPSPAP